MIVPRCSLAFAILLAAAGPLFAQSSDNPHVGYVFPGGGCRGTTFNVIVGGQHIKPASMEEKGKSSGAGDLRAFVSGGGITAKIVSWYRPLTAGEYNALQMKIREKTDELEKKLGEGKVSREMAIKEAKLTEDELKEMAIYEKREADPKRQPNPQIAEELTVQVTIAQDAAVGDRELRLVNETGMSNPLWFWVGQYPENREQEPNNIDANPEVQLQMPVVINGQIMPGDTDRFAFEGKKGTKLVAQCAARELIPYLADAVPGWFQAVLHLYDAQGNEVAFADSLGFRHDPVLYYEIPADGKYVLEIHDSIYRGREDFTYRITIGQIPYITGLFPLGGKVGAGCDVQVLGWNLFQDKVHIEPSFYRGWMIKPVFLEKDNYFTNRVGFLVDNLQEITEREENDTTETAQRVGTNVSINGRIERPGDVDVFRVDGAGITVAEVYARRLYSPLDSVVRLLDSRGKVLAHNDDYEDKSWPLITHHADSRLLTTIEAGQYISIGDAQGRGGPDFAYRLYIRSPRPDFDLRVAPSSVTAKAGTCVPITVHAIRKDGFDDDIALELQNAPSGFGLSGAWIPGKESKIRLTLIVPSKAPSEPIQLQLAGHAMIRGKPVSRPAMPADEWTQAFAYQHVVPTKDWTIFVAGSGGGNFGITCVDRGVKLPKTGTGNIRFMVDQGSNPRDFKFELTEPPAGVTLEDPQPVGMGPGLLLPVKIDGEKVKPGQKGNLLLTLSRQYTYREKKDGKEGKLVTSRGVVGLLPAIPYEVAAGRQ